MRSIRVITFLVAFCSIVYELLLSEISSTLLGGTFYRYILTIGLYIFCLGIGSIYYERMKNKDLYRSLFEVELALSILGLAAPLIPLLIEMSGSNLNPETHNLLVTTSVYALIIYIGLLSGLELPLLMAMGEKIEEGESIRVLTVDFIATFFGIIAFPLLFMKYLGLFNTSVVVGLINLGVFIFVGIRLNPIPRKTILIGTGFTLILALLNIFGAPYLVDRVFG